MGKNQFYRGANKVAFQKVKSNLVEAFNVKKIVKNSIQNDESIKENKHVETFEVKIFFSRILLH